MSDILIRGMEMPKSCQHCPMYSMSSHWCDAMNRNLTHAISKETGKAEWCPLVPVPPHGRLIDADQFYEDVTESAIMTDAFKEAFAMWLETQESIIPASDQEVNE